MSSSNATETKPATMTPTALARAYNEAMAVANGFKLVRDQQARDVVSLCAHQLAQAQRLEAYGLAVDRLQAALVHAKLGNKARAAECLMAKEDDPPSELLRNLAAPWSRA